MGLRGELFSTKVLLQNRTYFFNVKENRLGDLYLNIVESKNRDEGGFDRQSIILFADDLQDFLKGFEESLRVLEKEVREKRRSARAPAAGDAASNTKSNTKGEKRERTRHSGTDNRKTDPSEKPRRSRRPEEGKRIVVKKR